MSDFAALEGYWNTPIALDSLVTTWRSYDSDSARFVAGSQDEAKRLYVERTLQALRNSSNAVTGCVNILEQFSQGTLKISPWLEFFCLNVLENSVSRCPPGSLSSHHAFATVSSFAFRYIEYRTNPSTLLGPLPAYCRNAWVKLVVQLAQRDCDNDQAIMQLVESWISSTSSIVSQLGTEVLASICETFGSGKAKLPTARKCVLKQILLEKAPSIFASTCRLIDKLLVNWMAKADHGEEKQIECSLNILADLTSWWRPNDSVVASVTSVFLLDKLLKPQGMPPPSFVLAGWSGITLNLYSNILSQPWSTPQIQANLIKVLKRLCQVLEEVLHNRGDGAAAAATQHGKVNPCPANSASTSCSSLISDGEFNFELALLDIFCLVIQNNWTRLVKDDDFPSETAFLPLWWRWTVEQFNGENGEHDSYVKKKLRRSWRQILLERSSSKAEWRSEFLAFALAQCQLVKTTSKGGVKLKSSESEIFLKQASSATSKQLDEDMDDLASVIVQLVEAYPSDHLQYVLGYCLNNRAFDSDSAAAYVDVVGGLFQLFTTNVAEYYEVSGSVLQFVLLKLTPNSDENLLSIKTTASFLECLQASAPWVQLFLQQSTKGLTQNAEGASGIESRTIAESLITAMLQCTLYYLSSDLSAESVRTKAANLLLILSKVEGFDLLSNSDFYPSFLRDSMPQLLTLRTPVSVIQPLVWALANAFLSNTRLQEGEWEVRKQGFKDLVENVILQSNGADCPLLLLEWVAEGTSPTAKEALHFALSSNISSSLLALHNSQILDQPTLKSRLTWLLSLQRGLYRQLTAEQTKNFWNAALGVLSAVPHLWQLTSQEKSATASALLCKIFIFATHMCQQVLPKCVDAVAFYDSLTCTLTAVVEAKGLLLCTNHGCEVCSSYICAVGSLLKNQFKLFFPVSAAVSRLQRNTSASQLVVQKVANTRESGAASLVGNLAAIMLESNEFDLVIAASKQLTALDTSCNLFGQDFFQRSDSLYLKLSLSLIKKIFEPIPQVLLDTYSSVLWLIIAKGEPLFKESVLPKLASLTADDFRCGALVANALASGAALTSQQAFSEQLDLLSNELSALCEPS